MNSIASEWDTQKAYFVKRIKIKYKISEPLALEVGHFHCTIARVSEYHWKWDTSIARVLENDHF